MLHLIFRFQTSTKNNYFYKSFQALTNIRSPSFELYARTGVRIKDIKKTEFRMCQFSPNSTLYGIMFASFKAVPNLFEPLKGFLNIGKVTSDNGIVWNQFWCSLQQNLLKFYTYPDHEEENKYLELIDLNKCTSQVCRVDRPRTLLLEFLDEHEKKPEVNKIYLSANTAQVIKIWENAINRVFNTLTSWHCLEQ